MPQPNQATTPKTGPRLPTCSSCRWRINGACHRHAPTIVRGLLNGEAGVLAVWPQVEDGHGCGDHVFATKMEPSSLAPL